MPDAITLHTLARASPIHYQLYKSDREGIITAITWNQLATRGIDVLDHADIYEICMDPRLSEDDMQEVLEEIRDHDPSSGSLKLSSKQRGTLLGLCAVEMWSFPERSGEKDFDRCVRHMGGAGNPHFNIAFRQSCFSSIGPTHRYRVFTVLRNPLAKWPKELEAKTKLAVIRSWV